MKKFLFFILCTTIAFVVSSCKKDALKIDPNTLDNITGKCWYVTITQLVGGNTVSNSWYQYTTERNLVLSLQKDKDLPGYSASYKEDTRYVGQQSCERANEQ